MKQLFFVWLARLLYRGERMAWRKAYEAQVKAREAETDRRQDWN